jgi:hypothetical protein
MGASMQKMSAVRHATVQVLKARLEKETENEGLWDWTVEQVKYIEDILTYSIHYYRGKLEPNIGKKFRHSSQTRKLVPIATLNE